jgi:hypothetical protein
VAAEELTTQRSSDRDANAKAQQHDVRCDVAASAQDSLWQQKHDRDHDLGQAWNARFDNDPGHMWLRGCVRELWAQFKMGAGHSAEGEQESREVQRIACEYDERIAVMDEELAGSRLRRWTASVNRADRRRLEPRR